MDDKDRIFAYGAILFVVFLIILVGAMIDLDTLDDPAGEFYGINKWIMFSSTTIPDDIPLSTIPVENMPSVTNIPPATVGDGERYCTHGSVKYTGGEERCAGLGLIKVCTAGEWHDSVTCVMGTACVSYLTKDGAKMASCH